MSNITEQTHQERATTMLEWFDDDANRHKAALLIAARAIQQAEKSGIAEGIEVDALGAGIFGIGRFFEALRSVESVRMGLSSITRGSSVVPDDTAELMLSDWAEGMHSSETFYNAFEDRGVDLTVGSEQLLSIRAALEEIEAIRG